MIQRSSRLKHADKLQAQRKAKYDADPVTARANARKQQRATRELAIARYGGRCACCGEDRFEFLAIDHVEGGGTQHRKEVGSGTRFYYWLKREGFPAGFRVLCHNCNSALAYYGECPHQREKEAAHVVGD